MMGVYLKPHDLEAHRQTEAEARLKEFVAGLGKTGVPIDTRILIGEPFRDICRVAEKANVDMIVMGPHGQTASRQVLLRSVAERVVRHALCPVLLVGKKKPGRPQAVRAASKGEHRSSGALVPGSASASTSPKAASPPTSQATSRAPRLR